LKKDNKTDITAFRNVIVQAFNKLKTHLLSLLIKCFFFLSIFVKACCNKKIRRAMPKNNRTTSVVLLQSLVCYLPGRKGGGEVGWLVALLYRHKHRIFRVPRSTKLVPDLLYYKMYHSMNLPEGI
jgi:hypothetical protein